MHDAVRTELAIIVRFDVVHLGHWDTLRLELCNHGSNRRLNARAHARAHTYVHTFTHADGDTCVEVYMVYMSTS